MSRTTNIRRTIAATTVAAATVAGLAVLPSAAQASTATGATNPPPATPPAPGTPPAQAAVPTTPPSPAASRYEQRLMKQLQLRVTQLGDLSKEVSAATALTPGDQGALEQKIAASTTSINGLVQSVPADTLPELRAAYRTMIYQNRVFAVLTPQVYEVISSDTVAGQVSTFVAEEPALEAEVTTAQGQVGYRNAESHYAAFVSSVAAAQAETTRVSVTLLAQVPVDYPRDRALFVRSNRQILAAAEALARAGYDKTIVALATNGYTGS
ncbi:MAG: hypothetical protein M0Z33_04255 [Actinomycetota bacterium]|nr:hypothetical protein [Actinomycetota bacterium]